MMLNKDLYIFVTQPDRKGEPMDADVLSEKAKKLKHVKVYNRLYSMIQDGVYPPGSQLPSEPELALQMDVSRMTLRRALALLQENNLMQIVKLIGSDVLPDDQKLTIEIARVIRVGFLQQNAFHAVDTYVPLEKQLKMMETILYLYDKCAALVAKQVPVSRLLATGLFDELVQMKYTVPNDDLSKLDELQKAIDTKLAAVAQG